MPAFPPTTVEAESSRPEIAVDVDWPTTVPTIQVWGFPRAVPASLASVLDVRLDDVPVPFASDRHAGYGVSQRLRKRIEEPFGWIKAAAGLRRTRHRGLARVGWVVMLTAAACNLVRLPKLLAVVA